MVCTNWKTLRLWGGRGRLILLAIVLTGRRNEVKVFAKNSSCSSGYILIHLVPQILNHSNSAKKQHVNGQRTCGLRPPTRTNLSYMYGW